jgi:hypothetical protein
MRNELLDILSGKTTAISNEQLVDYLTGRLNESEKHDVEKALTNDGIDEEALEGLQLVINKEKIYQYDAELKKALREKLQQKKPKRLPKKQLQVNSILILTASILALILLVWVVIHLLYTAN